MERFSGQPQHGTEDLQHDLSPVENTDCINPAPELTVNQQVIRTMFAGKTPGELASYYRSEDRHVSKELEKLNTGIVNRFLNRKRIRHLSDVKRSNDSVVAMLVDDLHAEALDQNKTQTLYTALNIRNQEELASYSELVESGQVPNADRINFYNLSGQFEKLADVVSESFDFLKSEEFATADNIMKLQALQAAENALGVLCARNRYHKHSVEMARVLIDACDNAFKNALDGIGAKAEDAFKEGSSFIMATNIQELTAAHPLLSFTAGKLLEVGKTDIVQSGLARLASLGVAEHTFVLKERQRNGLKNSDEFIERIYGGDKYVDRKLIEHAQTMRDMFQMILSSQNPENIDTHNLTAYNKKQWLLDQDSTVIPSEYFHYLLYYVGYYKGHKTDDGRLKRAVPFPARSETIIEIMKLSGVSTSSYFYDYPRNEAEVR